MLAGSTSAGSASADTIQTVVGTGIAGYSAIGEQARETSVERPRGASGVPGGGIVWAEPSAHAVRAVGADGIVTLIAGTPGRPGRSGDGGPATQAKLDGPNAAVATADGGILIVDTTNDRIRLVSRDGVIRTVAGTGSAGYSGDGGAATAARLRSPTGIALVVGGGFLIADTGNHVVRRVHPDGSISTVAGTGSRGFSGDGGSATAARMSLPWAVTPVSGGGFLVADSGNQRVRRVGADGTITTVAGNGDRGYGGDGGPATSASLSDPHGIDALAGGAFLIADTGNHRLRRVAPDGTISTFAGTGAAGFSGDGGAAASARLTAPESVSVTPSGGVLVADTGNSRIRFVGVATPPVNVSRPILTGSSTLRGTLTVSAGSWRGTGPAIAYRWQRCDLDGRRCAGIDGATGKSYRVRSRDFGATLRARVTATNAAASVSAFSAVTGVGRLVRESFAVGGSGDDGVIRVVLEPGSKPRITLDGSGRSIRVSRSRLGDSRWEAGNGALRYDTSKLGDRLNVESATLLLHVLGARSDDRRALVVQLCPGLWPIDDNDVRAFAPPGGTRVPIGRIRRGAVAIDLDDPGGISLRGMTELCLYVSGRKPRGRNTVTLVSRDSSKERSPALVVTYRVGR